MVNISKSVCANLCTIIKLIMLRIIFCANNITRLIGANRIIYNYKWAKKVIDIRADP